MEKAIILDIDNCIANDEWRIRYIDWSAPSSDERYHEYHRRAGYDFAKNRALVRETHPSEYIVYSTGRPERYREYTERWLDKHYTPRGRDFALYMRGDHESRKPAVELKRRVLEQVSPLLEIVAAYDDRADIVEMYKKHGINAHVLAIHAKDAYVEPTPSRAKGAGGTTLHLPR